MLYRYTLIPEYVCVWLVHLGDELDCAWPETQDVVWRDGEADFDSVVKRV